MRGFKTTAVRQGEEYVVNGQKRWIKLGGVSDLMTLMVVDAHGGLSRLVLERSVCRARAAGYRARFESLQARFPNDIKKMKTKLHLLCPWVLEIAEDPQVPREIASLIAGSSAAAHAVGGTPCRPLITARGPRRRSVGHGAHVAESLVRSCIGGCQQACVPLLPA